MELASPEVVAELLALVAHARRSSRTGGAFDGEQPKNRSRGGRKMRCRCRRCPQCLEDARWERIFAEKFADPEYYSRRLVRSSSPLDSL